MPKQKTMKFYEKADWESIISSLGPEIREYLSMAQKYLLQNVKGKVLVLEAGCGEGSFIKDISRQVEKIVGIDFSKKMLKKARNKLKGIDNVVLLEGDIESLPLEKDYFDYCISMWTLVNLDNPKKFILSLKNVTKKGGVIFIDTYSENATPYRIKSYKKYGLTILDHNKDEILIREGLTEKIYDKEKLKNIFASCELNVKIIELTPYSYMCKARK